MDFQKYLKKYKNILIIGPLPPPLGGISVYIYRFQKQNNNCFVFSTIRKSTYAKFIGSFFRTIVRKNYDAINIHSDNILLLIVGFLIKNLYRVDLIISIHNARVFLTNCFIISFIKKLILNKANILLLVGKHLYDEFVMQGITKPQIFVENSFIPPPLEEEESILKTYPISLNEFIEKHSPILFANAFKIVFQNDVDLYGLDMCVELTYQLKSDFHGIGFVFALANGDHNHIYLNKIKEKINMHGITDNFYFLTGQKEIWPIYKNVDLMIRPTFSDGFGISVAEAIYFGVPAIASDVCERPEGTIVFKNRQISDLFRNSFELLKTRNIQ